MAYNRAGGPRKGRKKVCVFCVEKVKAETDRGRDFERRSAGTDGGDEFYRRSVCGFPGSLPGHSGN